MTKTLTAISSVLVPMLTPYADRIALFGSVARGDDGPTSDIDVLVSIRAPADRPPLGLRWFELEAELSERLGRPVEMVTEDALNARVRRFVEEDLVVLYEEG